MQLPVLPPVAPMLAKLARELPEGEGWWFEPKWDGFRCLAFFDGRSVELRSRNQRSLARYFPEVVDGLLRLPAGAVLDGELLVVDDEAFDFGALMKRLHPSESRVALLSRATPALFVAFDLLAAADQPLLDAPFATRRERLVELVAAGAGPVVVTPATTDRDTAAGWLERYTGAGIDGVVAKRGDGRYEPNRRSMVKVKRDRVADCVVAGVRLTSEGNVSSLLLGLYDGPVLRHVGVVTSLTAEARSVMAAALLPLVVPLEGHPWEEGFNMTPSPMGRLKGAAGRWTPELERDWEPLAPVTVAEVAYDQLDVDRFRHPARFRRWRPDRSPTSCTFDQFEVADVGAVRDVFGATPPGG